jgi:predicted transposase YdaD
MASVLALQDYRNRFWESSIEPITVKNKTMGIVEMIREREIKAIREESKAEGKIEGKVEGKVEVVKNLIEKMGLSDAQVSDITGMEVSFIAKIREGLKK